ncbi:MAG: NUDIX domain-containing protein [Candidatus Jordarchaeales archaeon]
MVGALRGVLGRNVVGGVCGGRPAAVLVPLVVLGGVVHVVLVKRSSGLRFHGGEYGFPGGVVEEGEGFVEAALREAEEEVGVGRGLVEVLGFLPVVRTLTGFVVVPVVGLLSLPEGFSFRVNPAEVEEVFVPPLEGLFRGRCVDAFGVCYVYDGRRVWGATARVLSRLFESLGWVRD